MAQMIAPGAAAAQRTPRVAAQRGPRAAARTAAASDVPAYRAFAVTVGRVQRLSPSFVRLTFVGPDLAHFGREGLDQRIKVVLPAPDGTAPRVEDFTAPDWYAQWRETPEAVRHPFRTYSIRAVRGQGAATELDVDFVLHGTGPSAGPASRWVAAVQPGATAVVNGPDARYAGPPVGLEFAPPAAAARIVLAGDETAAPAVCAILESLPAGTDVDAFLEIPTPDDALDVALPAGARLTWLPRTPGPRTTPAPVVPATAAADRAPASADAIVVSTHDGAPLPHGARLDAAVRTCMAGRASGCAVCSTGHTCGLAHSRIPDEVEDIDVDTTILWDTPGMRALASAAASTEPAPDAEPVRGSAGCYAWIAGEAATVRDLRRHLVQDLGIDRRWVAFMGYWRRGKAEA